MQQYIKNKDENVLEQSSVKVGGDMTRLTSILIAFKTALKLKNVLFSLLLDKEQSQNSLNINIKQRNTGGNIKSINQNSLRLDSNTSTASKSTSILNPENINEKMITHKSENTNMTPRNRQISKGLSAWIGPPDHGAFSIFFLPWRIRQPCVEPAQGDVDAPKRELEKRVA